MLNLVFIFHLHANLSGHRIDSVTKLNLT